MSLDGYRIAFGLAVLTLIDVLKVANAKLKYFLDDVTDDDNNQLKPFLFTYLRSFTLLVFLTGVCFTRTWYDFCVQSLSACWLSSSSKSKHNYSALQQNEFEDATDGCDLETSVLSESSWVPISINSENPSEFSGNDSERDDNKNNFKRPFDSKAKSKVRFSKLTEVKHLADTNDKDALKARLSYASTIRIEAEAARAANKLSPNDVIKLAVTFGILWFLSGVAHQLAVQRMTDVVVELIFATSSLFVILVSPIFSSGSRADAFSLSKVILVIVAFTSAASLMTTYEWSDGRIFLKSGGFWSLTSAITFAFSIIVLRRNVPNEDCLDVTIFLG